MSETEDRARRWLPFRRPLPDPALRLFCFPYVGGGAALFRPWPELVPASIEVCAVETPGRGTRLRETPFRRLTELVESFAADVEPLLDRPFALFGHSLGALVALELARHLRRTGAPPPAHLLVSGSEGPEREVAKEPMHRASDDAFLAHLRERGGTPPEVLASAEMMELFTPMLRADFEMLETYEVAQEPPLDLPLSVFGGDRDRWVRVERLDEWSSYAGGPFEVTVLPGEHFYVQTNRAELVAAVAKELVARGTVAAG